MGYKSFIGLAIIGLVLGQACPPGYEAGSDNVFKTIPYPYAQVVSIVDDWKNLTWLGIPNSDLVTLDGPDNMTNTTRFYTYGGSNIREKLLLYYNPPAGPSIQVYAVEQLTIGALTTFAPYALIYVAPVCGSHATEFNFTVNYCATNGALASDLYHGAHVKNVQDVAGYLGGANFSSCAALGNGTIRATGTTYPYPR